MGYKNIYHTISINLILCSNNNENVLKFKRMLQQRVLMNSHKENLKMFSLL